MASVLAATLKVFCPSWPDASRRISVEGIDWALWRMQPIAGEAFPRSSSGLSRHIELVRSVYGMRGDPGAMSAVTRRETVGLLSQGESEELMDRIYSSFEAYKAQHDAVIVEGTHSGGRALLLQCASCCSSSCMLRLLSSKQAVQHIHMSHVVAAHHMQVSGQHAEHLLKL